MAFGAVFAMLLSFVASAGPSGQADEFPADLGQWRVAPRLTGDDWWAAQNDDHEWAVAPGEAAPRVRLLGREPEAPPPLPFEIEPGAAKEGLAGTRKSIKVDDGWLVAFNAGEFGAGLWWFSPDGKDRQKISGHHVVDFFQVSSRVIAITGIEHGSMSKGQAIRLSKTEDGRWIARTLVGFGEAPLVAIRDGHDSLLIATHKRLLKYNMLTNTVVVLVRRALWHGLYPNSMVVSPSGVIHIGMRHGVAKIEVKHEGYKTSLLLPPKEFAEKPPLKEGFK